MRPVSGHAGAPSPSSALDPMVNRVRDLVYKTAGIFYPDNRLILLQDRCGRRLAELKVRTLREYGERLLHPVLGRDEMVKLLNEITIGETCFFRNHAQLQALRSVVLPRIISSHPALGPRRLRVWSAGCSTGEEPYTLAMFFMTECAAMLHGWTIQIEATDLNERSLEHAQKGVYGDYSVRNVNAHYRAKYFSEAGGELRIGPEPRNLVSFSRLNLNDAARAASVREMDLIFCANVLIYFDLDSKRKVIEQFHASLQPHGYFFLGHSESLYGVTDRFKLIHFPGATGYLKA